MIKLNLLGCRRHDKEPPRRGSSLVVQPQHRTIHTHKRKFNFKVLYRRRNETAFRGHYNLLFERTLKD